MGACASACSDDDGHARRSSSTDVDPTGGANGRPKRGFSGGNTTATGGGTADGSPKRNSPSNGNGNGNGNGKSFGANGDTAGGSTGSSGAAAGAGAGANGNDKNSGRKRSSSQSNSSDRVSGQNGTTNGGGSGVSGTTPSGSTAPIIPCQSSIPPGATALAEEHQKDLVPQPPLRKAGSGNALLTLPGKTPIPAKKYTFLLPETIVESPAMSPNASRGGSPTHGSGTGGHVHGHASSGPASPTFATNIRFTNANARTAEILARARELDAAHGAAAGGSGGHHSAHNSLLLQSASPTNGDDGGVFVTGSGYTHPAADAPHSGRDDRSGNNSSRRGSVGNNVLGGGNNSSRRGSIGNVANGNGGVGNAGNGSGRGAGNGQHPLGLHVRAGSGGSTDFIGAPLPLAPAQQADVVAGPGGPEDELQSQEQQQPLQRHAQTQPPSSVTPVLASAAAVVASGGDGGDGQPTRFSTTVECSGSTSSGDRTCSDSSSPPTAAHSAAAPPSTAGSSTGSVSTTRVSAATHGGGGGGVDSSPLWRPAHTLLHASTASTTTAGSAASSARGSTSAASDGDAARVSAAGVGVLHGTGAWARAEAPAGAGGFAGGSGMHTADQSRRSSAGPHAVAASA